MSRTTMKRLGLVPILLVAASVTAWSATLPNQVRSTLMRQVVAWNNGNLEGYMKYYWRSPHLTFFSGGTMTEGWEPVFERYKKRYKAEGKEMGQLDFRKVRVEVFGIDKAVARGHWELKFKNGKSSRGLFTLLLKKFPEGWRITHDHSSSETAE